MNRNLAYSALALAVSIAATLIAVAISMVIIAATGHSSVEAASALYRGAFGGPNAIGSTLSKMIPLTFVALGWIVAFTTKRVNIGFEGQMLIGGAAAAFLGLHMPGLFAPMHLGLAVMVGAAAGSAYAFIAAWLWARRSVNEIISTLLLNLIAIQIISWLVRGPMQESSRSFPRTDPIFASARWPHVLRNTALGYDLFVALALVFVVSFVLRRTEFGFHLRLTGANESAARSVGVATARITVLALVISGALAGLAGTSVILAGETGTMSDNFSAGFGFAGIVVALLARNAPSGVVPAALLIAALRQGGGLMEAQVGVPSSLVLVTEGIVILLVVASSIGFQRLWAVRVDAKASPWRDDRMPAALRADH